MARPQFYRFFLGDYLRDAAHLSLLEHGVYRRLIDLYMTAGEPLPFDLQRLYRVLHATSKEEQQAVQQVIDEFFRMDGPILRNHRCDLEIGWQDAVAAKAAGSANARWKSKLEQNQSDICDRNADALQTQSERNANGMLSRSIKEKEKKKTLGQNAARLAGSDGFKAFWSAYPRKVKNRLRSPSSPSWRQIQHSKQQCWRRSNWPVGHMIGPKTAADLSRTHRPGCMADAGRTKSIQQRKNAAS